MNCSTGCFDKSHLLLIVTFFICLSIECTWAFPVFVSKIGRDWFGNGSLDGDDWNIWKYPSYSSIGSVLSRHKRSNGTNSPPPPPKYNNAVEEFYADPNNRAMYLVLPLIILVYGGCSSIYCIHKCRQYIKRKKAQSDLNKAKERADSPTESQSGIEESIKPSHNTADSQNSSNDTLFLVDSEIVKQEDTAPEYSQQNHTLQSDKMDETLPLQDIENYSDHDNECKNVKEKIIDEETCFSEAPKGQEVPRIPSQNEGSYPPSREKVSHKPYVKAEPKATNETKAKQQQPEMRGKNNSISSNETAKMDDNVSKVKMGENEPKVKRFNDLSSKDIDDILNYYSNKKHMPDVIPADTENLVPLKRKAKKWRYRVFNT